MGEMKIKLENSLENKFRQLAMRRFGYSKGSISSAAQEAMKNWSDMQEYEINYEKDPIEDISGLMKKIKKSSVKLQHEAWSPIIRKHVKNDN